MANILLRALKAALPLPPALRQYASFTVREILTENSRQTGTFFLRLTKHLALENRLKMPAVTTSIRYADFFPINEIYQFEKQLKLTPADQLAALFTYAYTYRPSANPPVFAQVLNKLDAYALQKLPQMDDETVLHTLYGLLFLMPSWITLMDFYRAAMQKLAQNYAQSAERLNKDKFVQFCFYLGLDKKQATGSSRALEELLDVELGKYLDEMSALDLAIVCNASYKAALVVQQPEFAARLEAEVLKLDFSLCQVELMITYLKTLRLQRHKSPKICQYLGELAADAANLQKITVSGLMHIFAVFAENLWDEEASNQAFIDAFLSHLLDSNMHSNMHSNMNKFRQVASGHVRAKDLDMFLWCCAQLNCTLSQAHLQRLEQLLLQKVTNQEFASFPDQLVDACLSLWMLGFRSRPVYEQAELLKQQFAPKRRQPKVEARLTVLQTAVAIEEPSWLRSRTSSLGTSQLEAPNFLLKQRPDLLEFAERLSKEVGVAEAKIVCPIVGINIPSILVSFVDKQEPAVFVELLKNTQILHFSELPVGIMRLKLQLLHSLEHKVIALHEKDLEIYTDLKSLLGPTVEQHVTEEHTARSI